VVDVTGGSDDGCSCRHRSRRVAEGNAGRGAVRRVALSFGRSAPRCRIDGDDGPPASLLWTPRPPLRWSGSTGTSPERSENKVANTTSARVGTPEHRDKPWARREQGRRGPRRRPKKEVLPAQATAMTARQKDPRSCSGPDVGHSCRRETGWARGGRVDRTASTTSPTGRER
jgi:hypothetical protein